MKYQLILTAAVFLSKMSTLFAQSPLWVAPPNVIISGLPSPLPVVPSPTNDPSDPLDYYDGWSQIQGSAAIQNTSGGLEFFVIDGAIYDGTGAYKDYAWDDNLPPNVLSSGSGATTYQFDGSGGKEHLIVPHPVDCKKFYIFGIVSVWYGDPSPLPEKTLPGYNDGYPQYCLYDANIGQVIDRGHWYSPNPSVYPISVPNALFTDVSTTNPLLTNGDPQLLPSAWAQDLWGSTPSIAGTPLQPDGTRFVVCRLKENIFIIRINSDGTLRYWKRYNHSGFNTTPRNHSELELVFDQSQNKWRCAFEVEGTSINPIDGTSVSNKYIKLIEFSPDFLTLLSSYDVELPIEFNSTLADYYGRYVSGLEFSPNTQFLYVTSVSRQTNVIPSVLTIDTYLPAPIATIFGIPVSTSHNVRYGNIEKSTDGNLYFASPNGLYRLTSPNTPNPINFSAGVIIPVSIPTNYSVMGSSFLYSTTLTYSGNPLSGQIDQMDYTNLFPGNVECCKNDNTYDKNTYTLPVSESISPSTMNSISNTATNVVTIRDELRIKRGTVVTMTNMTVKFAPEARLVIEEGSNTSLGGRLILIGTKLTVDERCGTNLMWKGIEVRGISSINQGVSSTNTKQGVLDIKTGSVIEHAKIGAINYNTDAPTWTPTTGGIIFSSSSVFRNNEIDVEYRKYNFPIFGGFRNTKFITDSILKEVLEPKTHALLSQINTVRFNGCEFKNTEPSYIDDHRGIGITSFGAGYEVVPLIILPCKFENLEYGIRGITGLIKVRKSQFKENRFGIVTLGSNLLESTQNSFAIQEYTDRDSYGMATVSGTGYKIMENSFNAGVSLLANSRTIGCFTQNSGSANNLIYKNFFSDLKVGARAENTNSNLSAIGSVLPHEQGLVWKCNTHNNRTEPGTYDFMVYNGTIRKNQGLPAATGVVESLQAAANNDFTLELESGPTDHDYSLLLSPSFVITYWRPVGFPSIPNTYTAGAMNLGFTVNAPSGSPAYYSQQNANACPSLLGGTLPVYKSAIALNTINKDVIQQRLDDGEATSLLQFVQTGNLNTVRTNLLTKAPYASEDVLLAYLNRTPAHGHIKQVIIANSPVTQAVIDKINTMGLPNGIRSQILAVQTGELPRTVGRLLVEEYQFAIEQNLNDAIREIYFDSTLVNPYDSIKSLLVNRPEKFYQSFITDLAIQSKDDVFATPRVTNPIYTFGRTQEIQQIELTAIQSNMTCSEFISTNNSALATLENIKNDSTTYCLCAAKAKSILNEFNGIDFVLPPLDWPMTSYSAMVTTSYDEQSSNYNKLTKEFSCFPNPFKNEISILTPPNFEGTASIINVSNQEVKRIAIKGNSRLDLSELSQGIYFIQLFNSDDELQETHKIMKR
jgi:hypothetical protein